MVGRSYTEAERKIFTSCFLLRNNMAELVTERQRKKESQIAAVIMWKKPRIIVWRPGILRRVKWVRVKMKLRDLYHGKSH